MLGFGALGQFALGQFHVPDGSSPGLTNPTSSKGGWDPYYYKRRSAKRTKGADVEKFLADVPVETLNGAPEEISEQALAARIAANRFVQMKNEAERKAALAEINAFFALVRAEIARRADEIETEDFLLLS
jgi:hypothetical protein